MAHQLTVAVCTYKRPEGIQRCLESLLAQETSIDFGIVVVENEPSQISRPVVERFIPSAAEKGISLRYFCEPESNIAIARNRCVAEAKGEFLVFIDDDEWAEPNWLQSLVDVQAETQADVVWGNVLFEFPDGFPRSSRNIAFYRFEQTAKDVVEHPGFATNTTLIRRSLLDALKQPNEPGPFNPKYGKTGSEDGDLSLYFLTQNRKIIRTSRAVVHEMQNIRRGRFWFFIERNLREASCMAGISRKHFGFLASKQYMLKKTLRALGGIGWELPGILIHPRQSLIDIGCHAVVPLGYLCYFLHIRWKGY